MEIAIFHVHKHLQSYGTCMCAQYRRPNVCGGANIIGMLDGLILLYAGTYTAEGMDTCLLGAPDDAILQTGISENSCLVKVAHAVE